MGWLPRTSSEKNRAISIRSKNGAGGSSNSGGTGSGIMGTARKGFSFASLRGTVQPELSKRLYRLIKSENNVIGAHETAGRERISIATQLSEWGEQTNDEALSDISDKVGVVLSEIGEQEDSYAHALDDSRTVLKVIRNTEKSVQPSRDNKAKIADEIAKIKSKEPDSSRLVILEQELVRAEAENLVAEAQLFQREAYEAEFLATIERAEKQIILARHGQRLLKLMDDTPIVPGDTRPAYAYASQARQILNDAEDDLRDWEPELPDKDQGGANGETGVKAESVEEMTGAATEAATGDIKTANGAQNGTRLTQHTSDGSTATDATDAGPAPVNVQHGSAALLLLNEERVDGE